MLLFVQEPLRHKEEGITHYIFSFLGLGFHTVLDTCACPRVFLDLSLLIFK